MNYVTQSRTPNAGALLGALAIPAGVGVALAIGLVVTVTMPKPEDRIDAINVKPYVPPPPPDQPVEPAQTNTPQTARPAPDPVVPDTPISVSTNSPNISVAPVGTETSTIVSLPLPGGEITGPPIALPVLPDPIAAVPKGNPGSWIMERDYRANWIRQELSGVAAFTLNIDARGKVTDCTITRSTGHDVLDGATCRLLTRRARFDPARNATGDKVAGTYSSSVAWKIP
ncbi:MAG: TonB family protein [Pseudomonadota bacterium]